MATFESQNRRMPKIEACLKPTVWRASTPATRCCWPRASTAIRSSAASSHLLRQCCLGIHPGTAIAVKRGLKSAADCAAAIGEGLEAFTIPGSVAEQRKVGLGHGNLGAMLLHEDTHASLSWLAMNPLLLLKAQSALPVPPTKVRKEPLRVILNGWARMLPRSSAVSTVSPMSRPITTSRPAN